MNNQQRLTRLIDGRLHAFQNVSNLIMADAELDSVISQVESLANLLSRDIGKDTADAADLPDEVPRLAAAWIAIAEGKAIYIKIRMVS